MVAKNDYLGQSRFESLTSDTIKFSHPRVHVKACAKFHADIAYKLLVFKKFISISAFYRMHCKIARCKTAIACTFFIELWLLFSKFFKQIRFSQVVAIEQDSI